MGSQYPYVGLAVRFRLMERGMGTNVFWKDHLLVGLRIELDEPLGLGYLRP